MSFIKVFAVFLVLTGASTSFARPAGHMNASATQEENSMVSNGQGISSPSFWNGLSGQNPAGMINNDGLKIQGGLASFNDSFSSLRGSGAFLFGNSLLGAGIEYSKYNSFPYQDGEAQVNWGIAGRFTSIQTTFGVSGHHSTLSGGGSYDIGALVDLLSNLRFGAMATDIGHGLKGVGAGFTVGLDPAVELVLDSAYHLKSRSGVVKPGISVHTRLVHLAVGYGYRFVGEEDVILSSHFTVAAGIRFTNWLWAEYEYRGLTEHRVGLTLRLN